MRHRLRKNSAFGRHRGHSRALMRGLVTALVEHERIKTTLAKARQLRPLVEKAITLGKKNTLHARRLLFSRYPYSKLTAKKIVTDLSVRFKDRAGGYTRIVKLGPRSGDKADLAYLEFVDYDVLQYSQAQKITSPPPAPSPDEKKQLPLVKAPASKGETESDSASSSTTQAPKKVSKKQSGRKYNLSQVRKKRNKTLKIQKKSRRANRK